MRVGSSRVHIYRGSYFLIDILFQQFNVHEVMVLRECEYTRSHHMKYLWFSVLSRSQPRTQGLYSALAYEVVTQHARVWSHRGIPTTVNFVECKLQLDCTFCRLSFQWASHELLRITSLNKAPYKDMSQSWVRCDYIFNIFYQA